MEGRDAEVDGAAGAGVGEPPGAGTGEPPSTPPPAFFGELGAAFRRLRPQDSLEWGFAYVFERLETVVRRRIGLAEPGPVPPGPGRERDGAGRDRLDRTVRRAMGGKLEEIARRVVRQSVGPALDDVHEALDAAAEALRFLSARVERLETASTGRRAPVDAMAWLTPPPELSPWIEQVGRWLAAPTGGALGGVAGGEVVVGEVVVGECGDGALPLALAARGLRVRAAEPRGSVAWDAAAGGVDVHVGPVAELLASCPTGGLGAVVLAGVVDRAPLDELLGLVTVAADRLAPGAPLVVLSAGQGSWGPVALDLLPGHPLHPATWSLLLERAGFHDVEAVGRDGRPGTDRDGCAVRGIR
ncbi:MAG: hypothetical protein ACRDY3_02940 [Acidimicrobiales bacterium]